MSSPASALDALRTREVIFALLFGPPRFLQREEAYQVHAAVCDALSLDDLGFQYSTPERLTAPAQGAEPPPGTAGRGSSRAFAMTFNRKEGRGGLNIGLDTASGPEAVRLLMTYTWSASLDVTERQFDAATDAVFGALAGPWTRVLAEVRIRAECPTPQRNGLRFMQETLLGVSPSWVDSLGDPLSFAGVRLAVAAGHFGGDPLANPRRELQVEVLREDPSRLYLEQVSTWPQMPDPLPQAAPIQLDPASIRPVAEPPSRYIREAHDYLAEHLRTLCPPAS
jgi:hypothetical protein